MVDKEDIMVSVCMITYNHENYIAQAIEGVLMQRVNFAIELVIGEDCSTDNTRAICIEYQKKYPKIIRLRLPDRNLGMAVNGLENISACRGRYIAICEGDDYWIDPLKLQKQVDFLEATPDCVICFTDAKVMHQQTLSFLPNTILRNKLKRKRYTQKDIARKNFIPTLTVIFRNYIIGEFPEWFFTAFPSDWPLYVLLSGQGDIGFLNEPMAVYRMHSGGVCSGSLPYHNYNRYLSTIENMSKEFVISQDIQKSLLVAKMNIVFQQIKIGLRDLNIYVVINKTTSFIAASVEYAFVYLRSIKITKFMGHYEHPPYSRIVPAK